MKLKNNQETQHLLEFYDKKYPPLNDEKIIGMTTEKRNDLI